jgi:hypothetical protein
MEKITILYLCGIYNIILVILHILFWKIFNWKTTLNKGTNTNKIVTQIMNIQLIYLFAFMAIVYLYFTKELVQSKIGTIFLFGYAGFWIVRFFQQFIFLKQKGKFVIGLTSLFFVGAVLHLIPALL